MKALAIDSASRCITVCVKNDETYVKMSADTGARQSEIILPLIDTVFKQAGIQPAQLDFTVLCTGPGSFTSLRLAFAALKALQLTAGCPIYGLDTLQAVSEPFASWNGAVLPVLDARKNKFYAAVYRNGQEIVPVMDEEIGEIIKFCDSEERILAAGPDAELFAETASSLYPAHHFYTFPHIPADVCDVLLSHGEKCFQSGKPGLEEYQGPLYLRSEV